MPIDREKPLVSLILACYNQERFVAEAIDGVLSQTYSPLEVVIVDDCSRDRTTQAIEAKLADCSNPPHVRFIRHPRNMKARGHIHTGMAVTSGDFVISAGGDDIMLPDLVEEVTKVWIEEDVSLVAANAIYIDENSQPLGRTFSDPNGRADDSFETLARDGGNACCFGPFLGTERELYTRFGLPPEHLEVHDIMLPFYAYLLKGARFINKPLLKYRVHSGNTSLSLIQEKADKFSKLVTYDHDVYLHLVHSLFMTEELDRLAGEFPERYTQVAARILPLLTVQTTEMAKKFVRNRLDLEQCAIEQTQGEVSDASVLAIARRLSRLIARGSGAR